MIYADTSALGKLIAREPETDALRRWLRRAGVPGRESVATNQVGVVELNRLARRLPAAALEACAQLLASVDQLTLSAPVVSVAGALPPAALRSLDALHVASAADMSDLTALITYDQRMRAAAEAIGLPVESPGA